MTVDVRTPTLNDADYIVALSDAPTSVRARAAYVCDGTADEVQINAAIAAANAGTVKRIRLVGTTASIAAAITVYDHITVEGAAREARTAITCTGAFDAIVSGNAATSPTRFVTLRNLYIKGDGVATHGVHIKNAVGCTFDGVRVENFTGKAWFFETNTSYCGYCTLIDCMGRDSDYGLIAKDYTSVMRIFGGAFNGNTTAGIEIENGDNVSLYSVDASANDGHGFIFASDNLVCISPYTEANTIDYWVKSTAGRTIITGALTSGATPAMFRNDGAYTQFDYNRGSLTPSSSRAGAGGNLIPNGGMKYWPTASTTPPLLTFINETNWTSNTTKAKTSAGKLQLTSTSNQSSFFLDLSELVPFVKGETITAGLHWVGQAGNDGGAKRVRLFTTATGGYSGTKVDDDYKSYAFGASSDSTGENAAFGTVTVDASTTGLYLYFEVSSDATGNGDVITITDFFCNYGNTPSGSLPSPATEAGGYVGGNLYVGPTSLSVARADALAHPIALRPARDLKSGRYYGHQFSFGGTGTTLALAADTLYGVPFVLDETNTVDRIALNITGAAAAGKLLRIGLYSSIPGTYFPDALIVDSGALAADGTGIKIATISQSLVANTLYFLAAVTDGTPTVTAMSNSTLIFGHTDAADSGGRAMTTRAFTYAALPASWGTPAGYDGTVPHIVVRAS